MPSWGEDKNEPLPDLPQSHETEPDINGIKTITTYRKNELGQTIKVTQKVRVSKHTVKVSKPVLARRQWAKFGACQGKPRGYHGAGYQDAATTTIDISEQVLVRLYLALVVMLRRARCRLRGLRERRSWRRPLHVIRKALRLTDWQRWWWLRENRLRGPCRRSGRTTAASARRRRRPPWSPRRGRS